MRAFSLPVTTTATSLYDLIGEDVIRHTDQISLQAPEANASTIFFGDNKVQPFELRPCASAHVPQPNIKDVYVRGTPPDKLSVMIT